MAEAQGTSAALAAELERMQRIVTGAGDGARPRLTPAQRHNVVATAEAAIAHRFVRAIGDDPAVQAMNATPEAHQLAAMSLAGSLARHDGAGAGNPFRHTQLASAYSGELRFIAYAQERAGNQVDLEPIKRNVFEHADRLQAQDKAAAAVEGNTAELMAQYRALPSSHGGRYVGADLVKELFEDYSQSREARNRYNGPVHNSAAVLAAALFRDGLRNDAHPEQTTVAFLTGSPGAGKTTTVLSSDGVLDPHVRMVYEGQMFRPDQSFPKIEAVLQHGFRPEIIAVQPKPENALENTFRRFDHVGRGASIQVMSLIQGELAKGLRQVHSRFGEAVALRIFDYRDAVTAVERKGWPAVSVLESEGDQHAIQARLAVHLERHRAGGTITDACYRQAAGLAPSRVSLGDRRVGADADYERAEGERGSRSPLRADAARLLIVNSADYPNLRSDELARAHFVARQDTAWSQDYDTKHGASVAGRSQLLASEHGRVLAATLRNFSKEDSCRRYPELADLHASIAGALAHLRKGGAGDSAISAAQARLVDRHAQDLSRGCGPKAVQLLARERDAREAGHERPGCDTR